MSKVGFYRDLSYINYLNNNGIKLLDLGFDLNNVTQPDVWVLTITGTIAIERSERKLPTIISGNPWFGMPPYCLSLDDFLEKKTYNKSCAKEYFLKIMKNNLLDNFLGIGRPVKAEKGSESKFFDKFTRLIK